MEEILRILKFGGAAYTLAKLVLIVAVLGTVWVMADYAVSEVNAYIATLEDGEVGGYEVPVLGMLAYMGVFDGISVVIGAYLAILLIRLGYKVLGWL